MPATLGGLVSVATGIDATGVEGATVMVAVAVAVAVTVAEEGDGEGTGLPVLPTA
jgi:hypothetical protein